MIRGVRIHEFGGPEVLRIERVEGKEPGEGEVRIRIRAIGINRTEITLRSGRLLVKPPLPTKIGWEAAGEIEAIGPGVKGFAIGMEIKDVTPASSRGSNRSWLPVPVTMSFFPNHAKE